MSASGCYNRVIQRVKDFAASHPMPPSTSKVQSREPYSITDDCIGGGDVKTLSCAPLRLETRDYTGFNYPPAPATSDFAADDPALIVALAITGVILLIGFSATFF